MNRATWLMRLAILVAAAGVLPACNKKGDTGPRGPAGASGTGLPLISTLSATGLPADPGGTVTIQVIAQSPDGLTLSYDWNVVPGTWAVTGGAGTDTLTITAPTNFGVVGTATVTVTDTAGGIATGVLTLTTIGNQSPTIQSITAAPVPSSNGQIQTLTASATDPNGDPLTYTWTLPAGFILESGQGPAQATIRPTFWASGSASVVVDDGNGGVVGGSIFISTPPPSWGQAVHLDQEPVWDALAPKATVDPAGTVTAIWQEFDGTRHNIVSARYDRTAGSWGAPVLIETNDAGTAGSPRVAADASGHVTAVWVHSDGAFPNIWANRYDAGVGSWGTPELIDTGAPGNSFDPELAVDGAGNVTVIWEFQAQVWSNRYEPGTGWGTAEYIQSLPESAGKPQLAVASMGDVTAVWHQFDGTRNNIWSNRFDAVLGSWGTAQLLETDDAGSADSARVVADANGNVTAVWSQSDGMWFHILANRYEPGTGWAVPQPIESFPLGGHAILPRLAVDPDGNVTAAWQQDVLVFPTRYTVFSNRYDATTGTWGTEVPLETNDVGTAGIPALVADLLGNVTVAWRQSDGTSERMWWNRYDSASGSWATADLADGNTVGQHFFPCVVADDYGTVTAVWQHFDGIRENIVAFRLD